MNNVVIDWLPQLILLEDFNGKWDSYLSELYLRYTEDFHQYTPILESLCVRVRKGNPNEKDPTFWHLISEGSVETERTIDLRRCERIRWPRRIIEHDDNLEIRIWKSKRLKNGQLEERIIIALKDFSYIVVLAKIRNYFILITAYSVERKHTKRKLEKEYEEYKKGGFAF